MTHFWLALFELPGPPSGAGDSTVAEPILASGARRVAIEVLSSDDPAETGVLISDADRLDAAGELTALIGFASGANSCRVWRDRGFPLIDARIWREGNALHIASACFLTGNELQYDKTLLSIEGVEFKVAGGDACDCPARTYCQSQWSADYAWPGRLVISAPVTWTPERSGVQRQDGVSIGIGSPSTRSPNLVPLGRGGRFEATVWTGEIRLTGVDHRVEQRRLRSNRADTFGVPAFRFEDVEVLGFRIDLGRLRRHPPGTLIELVRDLNFHLAPAEGMEGRPGHRERAPPDFRYCIATTTIVIELLRYGKMKLRVPWAPLDILDYQSQHELVVRVLVGRVDDDSAQAHSPAVYVPAIFVDNPWSKVLGRDLQGFDKRLAHFCVPDGASWTALHPDGRLPRGMSNALPQPLHRIGRVYLAGTTGVDRPEEAGEPRLLDIDCSAATLSDAEFEPMNVDLALNSSALAFTRWRHSDFGDPEFRRSFARTAMGESVRGFRSVQVAPIGDRDGSLKNDWSTWITGTFAIDSDLRVAPTRGVATLTLHDEPSAPRSWTTLCTLLGVDDSKILSFPAGSWYRMRFSMDLNTDNGLA